MKLNWGHYIFISFSLFVLLILYMVYRSYQHKNELVSEDYYARELQFQNVIEKKGRAGQLKEDIRWEITATGILFTYPQEISEIEGRINVFRPSDKELDIDLEIERNSEGRQLIGEEKLKNGKYIIKIDWIGDGITYFTEGPVMVSK